MKPTQGTNSDGSEPIDVHRFQLSEGSEVRASLQMWKGDLLAHIRRWQTPKNGGEAYPGKGLAIDPERLPELLKSIALLMAAMDEPHG